MTLKDKARRYIKKRFTLKNLALSGVKVVVLGQFIWSPIMTGVFSFTHPRLARQIKIENDDIENLEELGDELTTRDYANLANGVVHRYSQEEHVCRHLSSATYQQYHELIAQTGRSDLENNVRLALIPSIIPGTEGHAWLEIYEDDKWVAFETTCGKFISDAREVKKYSEDTKAQRSDLPGMEIDDAQYRTILNSNLTYPTPKGFLFSYPAFFSSVYNWITE
jgi:hypothetical protein